jgi:hypothetical protein
MNPFTRMRLQHEADHAPGGIYDRMANYEGSPEYQAMLERNDGVAPGGGATKPFTEIGPRGGRYTMATTANGRPYRRYF